MRTALLLALLVLPTPAIACSLCNGISRNFSLAYEYEAAAVVAFGTIANPKMASTPGAGTTEFYIERIIKDDPAFPRQKMVLLSRYLPILEPKSPPKYVMFFRAPKQGLEPYWGKEVTSSAVLDFVADLHRLRNDPGKMLQHAAKHFDDADPNVADEAFLVFAKADDKMIAQHAKQLAPEGLRKLISTGDLEPERLSMYAYLLGACGNAKDAELLKSLLKNPQPRHFKAYEGILAGFITMQPKEGWAIAQKVLNDNKQSFVIRYATLRTMRFFYNAKREEAGAMVLAGMAMALNHSDISDIAIQDLRQWKCWEHTRSILACWDQKSHQSAIIKQSIVRYALACPQPEARAFLDRARRQEPDIVKSIEEELK